MKASSPIEEQLPWNSSFSASYIFSRGLHLPVFVDANLAPPVGTHTYDVLNSSGGLAQQSRCPGSRRAIVSIPRPVSS